MFKFTPNQMLVVTNLEDLCSSCTILFYLLITLSHSHKSFLLVVEIDLNDSKLLLCKNGFNRCDPFSWVKDVTVREAILWSRLASLLVIQREAKCIITTPLHLSDGWIEKLFKTFVCKFWKLYSANDVLNLVNWSNFLALNDWFFFDPFVFHTFFHFLLHLLSLFFHLLLFFVHKLL